MATKVEILKHYQEALRREWELESRFASIRRDLAMIAERKKMLEAALLSDAESAPASRPSRTLADLLASEGRDRLGDPATPEMPTAHTPLALTIIGATANPPTATSPSISRGTPEGNATPLPGLLRRRRMGTDSLPARILSWMEKYPLEQVHKAETICEAFPEEEKSLLLDALRRLHDRRQVVRPARGLYQIAALRESVTEEAPM